MRALTLALTLMLTTVSFGARPLWGKESGPAREGKAGQREEAEIHLKNGILAFREARFKDAIDSFLEANRLYPSASLSFNIAKAYEKLSDDAGALKFFRDYLSRSPNASDRVAIEERVSELEDHLRQRGIQQVTILSKPEGAKVIIDGRPVGVTPWTGELFPGLHELVFELDGYLREEQHFELPKHRSVEVTQQLTLMPRAALRNEGLGAASAGPGALELKGRDAGNSNRALWPWAFLGGAGAALGGAIYFEFSSRSSESKAREESTQAGASRHVRDMQGAQTTARLLAGVGGALAMTGGVWLLIESSPSEEPKAGLACGLSSCVFRRSF